MSERQALRRAEVRLRRRYRFTEQVRTAATPTERVSAAGDYLRAALRRLDLHTANREADEACRELVARAERIDLTTLGDTP